MIIWKHDHLKTTPLKPSEEGKFTSKLLSVFMEKSMAVRQASCTVQGILVKIGYIGDSIQMDMIKLFTSIKQVCKLDLDFRFFYLSFGSMSHRHSSAMQMDNIF